MGSETCAIIMTSLLREEQVRIFITFLNTHFTATSYKRLVGRSHLKASSNAVVDFFFFFLLSSQKSNDVFVFVEVFALQGCFFFITDGGKMINHSVCFVNHSPPPSKATNGELGGMCSVFFLG